MKLCLVVLYSHIYEFAFFNKPSLLWLFFTPFFLFYNSLTTLLFLCLIIINIPFIYYVGWKTKEQKLFFFQSLRVSVSSFMFDFYFIHILYIVVSCLFVCSYKITNMYLEFGNCLYVKIEI